MIFGWRVVSESQAIIVHAFNHCSASGCLAYANGSTIRETRKTPIGDVNNDGSITITDAQALYNYLHGNYTVDSNGFAYNDTKGIVFNLTVADINADGAVGENDIQPLLELVNAANSG